MGNSAKEIIGYIAASLGIEIIEMEVDRDHLHAMLKYPPTLSIDYIIKAIKQQSTFILWELHEPILRKHFWKKRAFWSKGYFASSVGQISAETLKQYIENQG